MRTLKEFFQFIQEEIAPEAPPNALFGQYLFSPTRDDTPDPKEKNTNPENQLQTALRNYIMGNAKGNLSKMANKLLQLTQQGLYKKILDPKTHPIVYRVIQVPWKTLPQLLQVKPEELRLWGVKGPGVLVPQGFPISGWTSSPHESIKVDKVQLGFALVLFAAATNSNNFFGNPGELAHSLALFDYEKEMETIAVGPVQYSKASYVIFSDEMMTPERQTWAIKQLLYGATTK